MTNEIEYYHFNITPRVAEVMKNSKEVCTICDTLPKEGEEWIETTIYANEEDLKENKIWELSTVAHKECVLKEIKGDSNE